MRTSNCLLIGSAESLLIGNELGFSIDVSRPIPIVADPLRRDPLKVITRLNRRRTSDASFSALR